MHVNWIDIVKEALDLAVADTGKAVTGAKLRAAVAKIAKNKSLEFPPPQLRKFADFIRQNPDFFEVMWRPGHDVLIAPQGQSELFKSASSERANNKTRIREDLFDAFTKLFSGKKAPFYLPTTDSVTWLEPKDGAPPELSIPIPQSSKETELQVRRAFLASLSGKPEAAAAIENSLTTVPELKLFTDAVRSNGLFEEWHSFRLEYLEAKLRSWAEHNSVDWQVGWIVNESQGTQTITSPPHPVNVPERKSLTEFISLLSDEDISRINIPLDIVLKFISSK